MHSQCCQLPGLLHKLGCELQARDPELLLEMLEAALIQRDVVMDHALFVPLQSSPLSVQGAATGMTTDMSWPHTLASIWQKRTARMSPALQVG